MKNITPFAIGDKVTWKWAGGVIKGQVEEIHFAPIEKIIKGSRIKRNGSVEKPAYLVKSEAGNIALKLHTELTEISHTSWASRRSCRTDPNKNNDHRHVAMPHTHMLNYKYLGGVMKSVAIVIAEKNFRDEEYQKPKEVLEKAGVKVVTASTTKNTVTGKLGQKVTPDALLGEININDFDALIFVGGGGAEQYFDDQTAIKLAKEAAEKNKIYAAICIAPVILANAGLLNHKKATVFQSEIAQIKEKGALFTDENVVIDGHLVTANGPSAAVNFGEAILNLLNRA